MAAPADPFSIGGLYRAYTLLFRTLSAGPPSWRIGLAVALASLPLLVESLCAPPGQRHWRRMLLGTALHGGMVVGCLVVSGPILAAYAAVLWTFARFLGPAWRLGRDGFPRALPVMAVLSIAIIGAWVLLLVNLHLLFLSQETVHLPRVLDAIERLGALLNAS